MEDKEFKFTEVFKYAKKIALASKDQVMAGRPSKIPCINWDKLPSDYTGFNDENYGTAIICDYIKELNQYLVVIDLDIPKPNSEHIPLEVLEDCMKPVINQTYSVRTGSGGIHVYLLSNEKPRAKQPRVNIDYQTNTGNMKGKYVVSDFIYDKYGNKIHYTKLEESPDIIFSVKNTDEVLNELLKILEEKGYKISPLTGYTSQIADIISRNLREGHRNDLALAISGYLRKQKFKYETTVQIIRTAFKNDEELNERLKVVNRAYKMNINDLRGWNALKDHLNGSDLRELESLVVGDELDLKSVIMRKLAKQQEPSNKELSDFLNHELTLYKDPKVMKYYERLEDGTINEIDNIRIEAFMNNEFGSNQISSAKCKNVLKYITNHIKRNYNIIIFNNGYLNTLTREFNPNKEELEEIPKLTLPFDWNPNARSGRIGELIDEILYDPKYPNNKELWLRAVGHAFMGSNRIGKMVMVQGESGTGKSTLTTILKRMFTGNFSEIKTQTIVKNERFTLHPLIGKAINIDDDISNGMLKGIGNLNSIITGNGLQVEIKGENNSIQAEAEQIPKLFANGNTLPPMIGTGIERRLLLIHADNEISYEDKDEYLQSDILSGKYDKDGIEWLIYNSINLYLDKLDEPLTTKEDEQRMKREYDFKAYPLKCGIEEIFEESYEETDYLEKKEVHRYIKQWCKEAYKNGLISSEHRNPSIKAINKAMDKAGFYDRRKTVNGDKISIYECIRLKDHWKYVFNPEINQQSQTIFTESTSSLY
ncbi:MULTISPECIES: DUF5906 domain-containing protein [Methanobacterium]|uniref:SF3 helicase domain-containing protein n=1 Tax=Methanobacterium bryantii TaxID=2161 RepID=A0A2A2H9D6_METBR|nr:MULTISPECIES: DUF5906 domain-containing protein [Methanobacterium]OEC85685.1 hypothetical protein A9507_13085 [Methanobacterium sp. A39]PAV05880.1 hypothetical protein ASJ80_13535 [Methanobacterium bryantii]